MLGVARVQFPNFLSVALGAVVRFDSAFPLARRAAQGAHAVFPRAFLAQGEFVVELALRGIIVVTTRVVTGRLGVCDIRLAGARGRARAQNIDSIIQLRQLLRAQRLEGTTSDESAAKKLFVYRFSPFPRTCSQVSALNGLLSIFIMSANRSCSRSTISLCRLRNALRLLSYFLFNNANLP